MPELPEVETIKRQLGKALVGQTIIDVQVLKPKSFHGEPNSIINSQIVGIRRFGKVLVIDLKSQRSEIRSQMSLVIHLKMTGQLIYEPVSVETHSNASLRRITGGHSTKDFTGQLPGKHTRVVIFLTERSDSTVLSTGGTELKPSRRVKQQVQNQASELSLPDSIAIRQRWRRIRSGKKTATLFFNDQRIFGWIKVIPTDQVEKLPFIARLGPESSDISEEQWSKIFHSSKKAVKLRLLDQYQIAGLGNIYANDALWLAKIHPQKSSRILTDAELTKLHQACNFILNEGISYGGATATDGQYIDLRGIRGKYQEHFKVYQRTGADCLRPKCSGIIQKISLAGRGTFWCPVCQR
jgi:formamidopyrimidine-DNA glycosylase